MSNRINGVFYIPSRKAELIDLIMPCWTGTKQQLKDMDRKRLLAIFYRIRQDGIIKIMRKPLPLESVTDNVENKESVL